ncbi:MAG: hypothetical protein ACKO6Q_04205 [Bacteroidota bacterium]
MENQMQQLIETLPQPVGQLAEQFPFSGPLQALAHIGSDSTPMLTALYFPFPRLQQAPLQAGSTQPVVVAESKQEEMPLFEPYHTIDYFASQGIKPPSLENPADRFGQQLKSFTDWLKVMKREPLTEVTRQIPVEKENQVAALAHDSLSDKQVWTEAMAEVWIKQGERLKAIGIYEKLSLLDPSKSAYFAAKINELKSLP